MIPDEVRHTEFVTQQDRMHRFWSSPHCEPWSFAKRKTNYIPVAFKKFFPTAQKTYCLFITKNVPFNKCIAVYIQNDTQHTRVHTSKIYSDFPAFKKLSVCNKHLWLTKLHGWRVQFSNIKYSVTSCWLELHGAVKVTRTLRRLTNFWLSEWKFWQHTATFILTLHSTVKFLREFSKNI
jgi:hypothetical protein